MYTRSVLDNGLRIVTNAMPHTHSVTIGLLVGVGSRYEADDTAGSTHFLEHLLFKGSRGWPRASDISQAIEGVGGVMNASTDREVTAYWSKVGRSHFERVLSILLDMLMYPLLDSDEIEKERQVILEELRMSDDYPSHRVNLLIDQMMWPDQPMGRDVGGTKESVVRIIRDDLTDLMSYQYTPANVVLSVAGNVSHDDVVKLVSDFTIDWMPQAPKQWAPVIRFQKEAAVAVEYRKSEQAHLSVGLPGLPLGHSDRYAISLVNTMLGEGMSSRLFLEVREKRGLAYDVHSSLEQYLDCGALTVYCGSEPTRITDAITAIMEELMGLEDGFSEDELDRAKEYSKGRFHLRMEDTRSVCMWQGGQELLLGEISTMGEVVDGIDAVSIEDVNRVAGEIMRREELNLAIVGPFRSDRRFQRFLKI